MPSYTSFGLALLHSEAQHQLHTISSTQNLHYTDSNRSIHPFSPKNMAPAVTANYRLIDIDGLDTDTQFPTELLHAQLPPVSLAEIQGYASQCRQLIQRGDQESALGFALENVPYGADDAGKVLPPSFSTPPLQLKSFGFGFWGLFSFLIACTDIVFF